MRSLGAVMTLLPQPVNSDHYWRAIHKQELPVWQPALAEIAALHQLPGESWARVPLGRNIVFCSPTSIIKLGPPCWPGETVREIAALHFVAEKISIETPTVLASGTLDQWEYIVQARLPGTPLWELWPQLPLKARTDLAFQHGRLMAQIHSISIQHAPSEIQFNWNALLAEQSEQCAAAMHHAGINTQLVAQIDAYLAATVWSVDPVPDVLLHGDLNHLNFLVSADDDRWQLSGVIDWGDAKIGPPTHELISPGVHMYKGNPAMLTQWYQGYELNHEKRTEELEHVVMARAMLYYADIFPQLLRTVEGAATCRDWRSIADCFWHLT